LHKEYYNFNPRPGAPKEAQMAAHAEHIQAVDRRMKDKGMDKAVANLLKHFADPTLVDLVDGPDFKRTRRQAYKFTAWPKVLKIVVNDIQEYETWVDLIEKHHRSAISQPITRA
jgi:hypothetical protein